MKKHITRLLFAALLLLALCIGASAAGTSGKCGPSAYWSFDSSTGTLTISGSGAMNDCVFQWGRPVECISKRDQNRCDRGFDYENRERVIFQLILHYSQDWKKCAGDR